MQIKHEIIDFSPEYGSVLVKYTTETNTQGLVYNIDLPINEGKYPTIEEIETILVFNEPKGQLERFDLIKTTPVPNYLTNLIAPPPPAPEINPDDAPLITGVDPLPTA